jgi:hypothetical protein
MADQWIIRVQGKEYGPVDVETLREWKAEGRVLPANEARRANVDLWTTASEIPGLFEVTVARVAEAEEIVKTSPRQHRSLARILSHALRIYGKGFLQFLSLTLLVVLPSVCGQLATAWAQTASNVTADPRTLAAGAFAFCMMVLTMVLWPIYIAGIQILTTEFAAGHRTGFVPALNEAVKFWPRVAVLCIFVYGVFFLLMLFAFGIAAMLVAGAPSLLLVFFALALLVLQVWMFSRFFVNVLFWQQFAVLENAGAIDSLRASRSLAASGRNLAWFQRPLWRGVFIASIWFAFVLAITLGPEWATLRQYFNEMMTMQDPQALLEKLTAAQQAHGFDIFSFSLGLLQRILQPLLGIAFVLLYLDSKTRNAKG